MSLINYWDTFDLDNSAKSVFDSLIKDLDVARRGHVHSRRFPVLEVHETEGDFIINAELPVCNFFFFLFV